MTESNVILGLAGIAIVVGLWVQYRRNRGRERPCTIYWGALFLLLFIIMPIASNLFYGPAMGVGGSPRQITNDHVYLIYSVAVLLFAVIYLLMSPASVLPRDQERPRRGHLVERLHVRRTQGDRFTHLALGILIILGLMLFIAGTGLSWRRILTESRFVYFQLGTARTSLLLLGQYLVGLVAVYAFTDAKEGIPSPWLSLVVYAAVGAMIGLAGGRKWIIFIASGVLAGSYDRRGGMHINVWMISGVVAAVVVLVIWQAVRAVSWYEPQILSSLPSDLLTRLPALVWHGDVTHFYRASLEAIQLNLSEDVVYPFALVRRLILLPFPSEWTFGLKPEGIPFLFADQLNFESAARRGNLPPGLLGIFALSFGWKVGAIVGPVVTLVAVRLADTFVVRSSSWAREVAFANAVVVMVLLMRGSEGGVYFAVFSLFVVGGIRTMLSVLGKAASRPGVMG